MKKHIKKELTMVETLNDDNAWTWWAVVDNATPEKAIRACIEDVYAPEKDDAISITKEGGTYYADRYDVRAYTITTISI